MLKWEKNSNLNSELILIEYFVCDGSCFLVHSLLARYSLDVEVYCATIPTYYQMPFIKWQERRMFTQQYYVLRQGYTS